MHKRRGSLNVSSTRAGAASLGLPPGAGDAHERATVDGGTISVVSTPLPPHCLCSRLLSLSRACSALGSPSLPIYSLPFAFRRYTRQPECDERMKVSYRRGTESLSEDYTLTAARKYRKQGVVRPQIGCSAKHGRTIQLYGVLFEAELAPNQVAERILYFTMPRNRRLFSVRGIRIDIVAAAMPLEIAACLDQLPQEFMTLQTASSICLV